MRWSLCFLTKLRGFPYQLNHINRQLTTFSDTYLSASKLCSCFHGYDWRATSNLIKATTSRVRKRGGSKSYCSAAQDYTWNFSRILQQPGWLLRLCTHKIYLSILNIKIAETQEEFLNHLTARTDKFSGDEIALLWREIIKQSYKQIQLCEVLELCAVFGNKGCHNDKKHSISHEDENTSPSALHEAGHAVAGWFTCYSPLTEVSMKSTIGKFAKPLDSKMQIDDMMVMGLGGLCAEMIHDGPIITPGAHQDIQKVILMAYFQVLRFGMSENLGPLAFTSPGISGIQRPYSKKYLQLCEGEILKVFNDAYEHTNEILQTNKGALQKVADHLKQKSILNTKHMERLLKTRKCINHKRDIYEHIPPTFHDDPRFTEKRIRVAFHEAGHAVISWFLHYTSPVLQISIIDKPGYRGGSIYDTRRVIYKQQIDDALCMCLGGRESERLFFDEINSGSWNDMLSLTNEAYEQVESSLSVKLKSIPKNVKEMQAGHSLPYSESLAEYIDSEVFKNVQTAERRAKELISQKKEDISKIAIELLRREVQDYHEVEKILGPRPSSQKKLTLVLQGQVLWKYKALFTVVLAVLLDSLYLSYGSHK